jgi:FlaA1/EpsC-like NDP-sugar epimerase
MAPYVSFAVATLVVLLLDRDGAYRAGNSLLRIKETERSLPVSVQAIALILPIAFLAGGFVPRAIFVIAMAGVPLLLTFEKQLLFLGVRALRARGYGVRNLLIYGAGESGRRIYSALVRSPRLGLNPVAFVDDDAALDGQDVFAPGYRRPHAVKIVSGPVTEQLLTQYGCTLFVIAIPNLTPERFSSAVRAAEGEDAAVTFLPRDPAFSLGRTEHADIDGILLNVMRKPETDWSYEIVKRVFDRLAAVLLLVLIAPAWLVIALLVHFD